MNVIRRELAVLYRPDIYIGHESRLLLIKTDIDTLEFVLFTIPTTQVFIIIINAKLHLREDFNDMKLITG